MSDLTHLNIKRLIYNANYKFKDFVDVPKSVSYLEIYNNPDMVSFKGLENTNLLELTLSDEHNIRSLKYLPKTLNSLKFSTNV